MTRWRNRAVILAALVPAALALSGCGALGDFVSRRTPVVASIDVFNRTEADIFYVAADGERLDVPACGRAEDSTFRIDDVRVRAADGYIRAFAVGAADFAGAETYLIEVANAADSGIPSRGEPPAALPPCEGLPQVQPGN